jgi:hypothetical protein
MRHMLAQKNALEAMQGRHNDAVTRASHMEHKLTHLQ